MCQGCSVVVNSDQCRLIAAKDGQLCSIFWWCLTVDDDSDGSCWVISYKGWQYTETLRITTPRMSKIKLSCVFMIFVVSLSVVGNRIGSRVLCLQISVVKPGERHLIISFQDHKLYTGRSYDCGNSSGPLHLEWDHSLVFANYCQVKLRNLRNFRKSMMFRAIFSTFRRAYLGLMVFRWSTWQDGNQQVLLLPCLISAGDQPEAPPPRCVTWLVTRWWVNTSFGTPKLWHTTENQLVGCAGIVSSGSWIMLMLVYRQPYWLQIKRIETVISMVWLDNHKLMVVW